MVASGYDLQLAEAGDLTLDLGLDVERLLASPDPAVVAGLDQITDLLAELRIDLGRGQPSQLLIDIDRRLATAAAAGVARLEHLPDLLVALLEAGGGARARGPCGFRIHREPALAE